MEQTKLRTFAEAVYKAREEKLTEIRKQKKEEWQKLKEDAEEYATMCLQIFAISTNYADDVNSWVKKVRIFQEGGNLQCQVMLAKNEKKETWSTIKNSSYDADLQAIVENMKNIERLKIDPIFTLAYMAEALKDIQHFVIEYNSIASEIIIIMQEIVDENN